MKKKEEKGREEKGKKQGMNECKSPMAKGNKNRQPGQLRKRTRRDRARNIGRRGEEKEGSKFQREKER